MIDRIWCDCGAVATYRSLQENNYSQMRDEERSWSIFSILFQARNIILSPVETEEI